MLLGKKMVIYQMIYATKFLMPSSVISCIVNITIFV